MRAFRLFLGFLMAVTFFIFGVSLLLQATVGISIILASCFLVQGGCYWVMGDMIKEEK